MQKLQLVNVTSEKYLEVYNKISEIKNKYKSELEPLEVIREELSSKLVEAMTKTGMKSKDMGGVILTKGVRASYQVTDEEKAIEWAKEYNCVSIDRLKASKIFRNIPLSKLPKGFSLEETSYITVKKHNQDAD